jgi:DNA ligase 4
MTAAEHKWVVRIILKDLKLGFGEKTVLKEWHPDANEAINIQNNLRTVCQLLKDPNKKLTQMIDYDIKPGMHVKPMLATRKSPQDVVRAMNNEPFFIEQKFDGERVLIHKNHDEIRLFSRNGNRVDHTYSGFVEVARQHIKARVCIIDGELLIWDNDKNDFEEFGKMKTFAKVRFWSLWKKSARRVVDSHTLSCRTIGQRASSNWHNTCDKPTTKMTLTWPVLTQLTPRNWMMLHDSPGLPVAMML